MEDEDLRRAWQKEEKENFKRWDFSHLEGVIKDEPLPWNYKDIVKKYLKKEYKLLDMHTGGGEFVLSLNHPYKNTYLTEGWKPNVKLCIEKLSPLGINVYEANNDNNLPFKDNFFDIIINRHGHFDIKEIRRILKPKGLFITQQVGEKNNENLSKKLIRDFNSKYTNHNLKNISKEIKESFFDILYKEEYFPYLRFYDIKAIVYFAKIIKWEFPDFSVEKCFERLKEINQEIRKKQYFESVQHRFIIVARKD